MASIDELKKEYDALFEKEKKIDEEIQQMLGNQHVVESKFNSLKPIVNNIQMIYKDAQSLSNMINFTATLADNVSSKVRQLDLAKSRVVSCVKRVTDILDLKACTDGVTEALAEENYEAAANHIHRYLKLDKDSLRLKGDTADPTDTNYLDNSFELLQESKTRLQHIVNEKYDQAVLANDAPQMERFFKIFPLIGLANDGLDKFAAYLCKQIEEAARANYDLLKDIDRSESRWSVVFADALILLFERVARAVEAYQPVIEASYGHGHMFAFVRKIQRECDTQAVRILDKFKEVRRVAHVFRTVQQANAGSYARQASGALAGNSAGAAATTVAARPDDKLDPRDLDELLTEITLVSSRSELYKNFLLKCIVADLNGVGAEHKERTQVTLTQVQTFMNSTGLQCCIQELIGQYSILENYFMTENIHKAIQMDNVSRQGALTSSVVDDVFFIIKKCIKRCLCSDSVDGCCAMFNNSSSALESIYKDYFFAKLKLGYPSGFDLTQAYSAIQRRFQAAGDQAEKQKLQFLITLNNIDQSIEWIATIRKLFEDDISKLFAQESQSAQDKLNSCLSDLSSVSGRFKELLDFGFNQLNLNELRPRIKQWCEAYTTINHRINEDEFSQYEAVDPFVQNFIKNIEQMISSIKDHLSTKNQDIFAGLVASEVVSLLEKNLFKTSYSKYGGLQLDKEVRILVNYLTSLTSWSTREKFSRLSQIAILLSLDSLPELYEYWNSSLTITWRLTPNEIRQILLLRSDFKPEEVKALKL